MSNISYHNSIKKILDAKGFYPSKERLISSGLSPKKFTRMYNNLSQPNVIEALIISAMLNVTVEEIIVVDKNENPLTRHGLVKAS